MLAVALSVLVHVGRVQACVTTIDLNTKGLALAGRLEFHVFPGPPEFEDVRKGDQPEPTYILHLDEAVCAIHGDDDPGEVDRVQVYSDKRELTDRMRALVGSHVSVAAAEAYVGMTGHHHAPLSAEITAVDRDSEGVPGMDAPGATTVRGFYEALAAGAGAEAAAFVVPEKRISGPLSGPALSRFYGSLPSPLTLRSVEPLGPGQFEASYTYSTHAVSCDGHSVISLARRGELFLISGIHSLTRC